MDILGIDKVRDYVLKKRESDMRLRDFAYKTVGESQEFVFKMLGKSGSKEYWEWKLKFDKERFGIEDK